MKITKRITYAAGDIGKLFLPHLRHQAGYYVDHDRAFVYINNPKVASESIKFAMATKPDQPLKEISAAFETFVAPPENYFCFTVCRNPFHRLVSCYKHKIANDPKALRRPYGLVSLTTEESFDSFVRKVARIPDALADIHFMSQTKHLYHKNSPSIDALIRFENLSTDFAAVGEKAGLLPLPHTHKTNSDNWIHYYTPELVTLVYKRYYDDVHRLGYEDAYNELQSHLAQ